MRQSPLTDRAKKQRLKTAFLEQRRSSASFNQPVKSLIHDYSGGVPRQINNLASACLLQAVAHNSMRVDERLLQQTLAEFHLP